MIRLLGVLILFLSLFNWDIKTLWGLKAQPTVYIAGYQRSGSVTRAKLWSSNGMSTDFVGSPGPTRTFGIAGSETSLVICGYDGSRAVLWKDYKQFTLSENAIATSVEVYKDEIYVVGLKRSRGVYWKNGVEILLDVFSTARGIAVHKEDVYICGDDTTRNVDKRIALLWKNGKVSELSSGTAAFAIAVYDGVVYVVGTRANSVGVLWMNGKPTDLKYPDFANYALGNCIAIEDGDVYVGGFITYGYPQRRKLVYWKNNEDPVEVYDGTGGAIADIAVKGGNVYLGGYTTDGNKTTATYWINGHSFPLLGDNTEATGIFLDN